VSWIGFFPTTPTNPTVQPPPGGGTPGSTPPPVAQPEVPPIFDWTQPNIDTVTPAATPPDNSPPGNINGAPEPATLIGALVGISAVGIWLRRRRLGFRS
jgi:hypothetical protein